MLTILKISIRNLFRQKRRNILLGIGMAVGMCILVLANAFSHGITDILLNKILLKVSGHLVVTMVEKDGKQQRVIRDKERIKQIIFDHVDNVKMIREDIVTFGRALGKSKGQSVALFGIEPDDAFYRETEIIAGNLEDFENPRIEHPTLVYKKMAEKLGVRHNDVIRMRFRTIYGQIQTVNLTVVAIIKAGNPFFDLVLYCPLKDIKLLLGYQQQETMMLSIVLDHLKEPKHVLEVATRLHDAFYPEGAGYTGEIRHGDQAHTVNVFSIRPEQESRDLFMSYVQTLEGSLNDALEYDNTVILDQTTAEKLGVHVGDTITLTYESRFAGISSPKNYSVGAIFQANHIIKENMIFAPIERFCETYFPSPPKHIVEIDSQNPLFPILVKEWILLERSPNKKVLEEKYWALNSRGWQGAILDVQTMYEFAGEVLELESVINGMTIIIVAILFFIILLGVVNTLRMTIRERTREIGTIRAIGMHRSEVRLSFVLEVLLLALFSCSIGIVIALFLMTGLSALSFDIQGDFAIFLVNKHLHFVPQFSAIMTNLVVILFIVLLTAYFPSGKAAKLSVAEALRHHE